MFNNNEYVFNGFKDAVGSMPDYWVILNSAVWAEKGVLTQDDLAALQALIDEKNTPPVVEADATLTEQGA